MIDLWSITLIFEEQIFFFWFCFVWICLTKWCYCYNSLYESGIIFDALWKTLIFLFFFQLFVLSRHIQKLFYIHVCLYSDDCAPAVLLLPLITNDSVSLLLVRSPRRRPLWCWCWWWWHTHAHKETNIIVI